MILGINSVFRRLAESLEGQRARPDPVQFGMIGEANARDGLVL
jgi:hypothetical protein